MAAADIQTDTDTTRATNAPRLFGPGFFGTVALVGASLALGAALTLEADARDGLTSDKLVAIEFLSQDGALLDRALEEACAWTGCDAALLRHMIVVETAEMSATQLEEALRIEEMYLTSLHAAIDSARAEGRAGALPRLRAETEAGVQTAALYRAALRALD